MNLASLFLRAVDRSGEIYFPYSFDGPFTEDERAVIERAIDPHVPERVDAGFNNWLFMKVDSHLYLVKQATWHSLVACSSAESMAEYLAGYYRPANWTSG